MDQQPAAWSSHDPVPGPQPAHPADTIEEETGEGLLLNDPLIMSMYQSSSPAKPQSPASSPDSSPVRQVPVSEQLAEESLSDREFEQMEAAAAAAAVVTDVSETKDFTDFGHPNLLDGDQQYVIDEQDPFRTPAKTGTKSSDEEEYEVIPQTAADVSNLLSLSPERSSIAAADTTIIDAVSEEEAEKFAPAASPLPPPLPAAAPPAVTAANEMVIEETAVGAEAGESSDSAASSPDDDIAHVLSARPPIPIPSSESDSEPEPDPVSAPHPVSVPVLPAAPKKTDSDETIARTPIQQQQSHGPHTVSMASADSSTSGCPFTACKFLLPVPGH